MRRLLAVLMTVWLFLLVAPGARADSGGSTDPDDTSGKLDVLALTHSDTADAANAADRNVTLALELYNTWKPTDTPYYTIAWLFDFDNDGAVDDGCLILESDDGDHPNQIQYALVKGDCDSGTGSRQLIAAGLATQPSTAKVSAVVPLSYLKGAGQTGDSYRYRVNTFDGEDTEPTDEAPLGTALVTHKLGQPVAPTTTTTVASQSVATANPSVLAAGANTTVSGSGFAANAPLKATLFSDPVVLANFTADAAGKYSISLTIPANTLPGTHRIVVSGLNAAGAAHESTATITIVLPRTGAANTGRTTATGVAVLALGFAVLSLAYYERRIVSVGASRAAHAIGQAIGRFED